MDDRRRLVTAVHGSLLALFVLLCVGVPRAHAVVEVTVDSTTDGSTGACDDATPNDCNLRGAIAAANLRTEETIIHIPSGHYVLSGTSPCTLNTVQFGTLNGPLPSLCLNGPITLDGAGAETTILDANLLGRVIVAANTFPITIRGVTLQNGRQLNAGGFGGGGGLNASGADIRLVDSVVRLNSADAGGGGIYNSGVLSIVRTRILGNLAAVNGGGGIQNFRSQNFATRLEIVDSTIADNQSPQGAGLFNFAGVFSLTGSTVSGNETTSTNGAGIYTIGGNFLGEARIVNSTISGNTAKFGIGGGIYVHFLTHTVIENSTITDNQGGIDVLNRGLGGGIGQASGGVPEELEIGNTILAGNRVVNGPGPDCYAAFLSRGHNLIGDGADCVVGGDTTGNQIGADPLLGSLADNGGLTETHALADGSPAIDAGSDAAPGSGGGACAFTDQRGVVRPLGDGCDVGAYERSAAFEVTNVRPPRGGRGGTTVASIAGNAFDSGASVRLVRSGESDRIGAPTSVLPGGSSITTSFDLVDAAEGAWDVVVENEDGSEAVLPGAFTVEPEADPELWVTVLGRNRIRTGRLASYTIHFGNRGNVDAVAVPITVSIPGGYALSRYFDQEPPPALPGQVDTDWTGQPETVVVDGVTGLSNATWILPRVPAGFSGYIRIALLTPPGAIDTSMLVVIAEPLVQRGEIAPDLVASAVAGARAYAEVALGTPVPAEHDATLAAYATGQIDAIVADGLASLVADDGLQQHLYPQAHLLLDLALYAQSLAQGANASPLSRFASFAGRRLAPMFDLLSPAVVLAAPCTGPLTPGQSCSDDPKPVPPPPKDPPPLTPADCRSLPNHTVVGDSCVPSDRRKCGRLPNPFIATDPDCTSYPIGPRDSIDPNDKVGVLGGAAGHWITPDVPLGYTIFFENLETAAAPAQTVEITDQLDSASLDLSTFALGPIGFGTLGLAPPPGAQTFSGAIDLRPDLPLIVSVQAGLDTDTGIVTWRFTSIDPTTGQLTEDPDLGFLPPNVTPPEGDGFVGFTVQPKPGLATGTTISNGASIVFDVNAPIDTPTWTNSIDGTAPSSAVASAVPADCTGGLTVTWSGADAGGGIASYDVSVSTDGGPFGIWQEATTETSAVYAGEIGRSYAFQSVARDVAGNAEAPPATPDVTVTAGGCAGRDLAVTAIRARPVVKLTDRRPDRTVLVKVQIQNRGPAPETIPDETTLARLVALEAESLGACATPAVALVDGKPQKKLPATVKSKAKLNVAFEIAIDCANDPAKGTPDFRLSARVDATALGGGDGHPDDDVCPRQVTPPGVADPNPDGKILDKGCGAKRSDRTFGDPVELDVQRK